MRRLFILAVLIPGLAFGFQSSEDPSVQDPEPPVETPEDPDPEPLPTITIDPAKKLFFLDKAAFVDRDGQNVKMAGGVKFRYGDYIGSAEEVEGNLDTEIFVLKGDVKLIGKDLNYEGEEIEANFKTEVFGFKRASSTIKPELIKGQITENLYIRGESGTGSEKYYELVNGECTTCGLPHAHYHIKARKMSVYPQDRLVMRDAEINILGKTIIRLPYFSIPLKDYAPRYIPETGQSPDEGYFIKSRFGVGIPGDDLLDTRFDYMTKLGFGLGADLDYRDVNMKGALKVYGLLGQDKTFTSNVNHTQKWGRSTITSTLDLSQRNYLSAPGNTTLNTRNSIAIPNGGGNTRLGFTYSSNKANNFSTESQNLTLNDQRKIGKINISNDFNLSTYLSGGSSFSSSRRVLDVRSRAQQSLDRIDIEMQYQRAIPIGTIANFFSGTEITPMLTFKTDTARISGDKNSRTKLNMEMSVGELFDSIRKKPISRTYFDLGLPTQTIKSGSFSINGSGRFRQGLYSDDTAQFVFNSDMGLSYQFDTAGSANIRYNYLRAQGYTPLNIDRAGRNDFFGADLNWKLKQLNLAATTGYDLLQSEREGLNRTPWQTVGIRAEYSPTSGFDIRTSTSYDTFNKVWSNVRADIRYEKGKSKYLLGLRYDGQRHTWGAANFFAEGLRWGRLQTAFLLSYNGYTKEFESRQFNFIYDMHCSEAVLTIIENNVGFRTGRQVGFYIRLKAFPFNTGFGTGTRGQGFGVGSGNF
jgi:LPS-assembly protein